MPNDPEATYQMWVIPREMETRIIREKENWYVEVFGGGPRMQIDARQGQIIIEGIESYRADLWERHKKGTIAQREGRD